jgi:hypothetical protein
MYNLDFFMNVLKNESINNKDEESNKSIDPLE